VVVKVMEATCSLRVAVVRCVFVEGGVIWLGQCMQSGWKVVEGEIDVGYAIEE